MTARVPELLYRTMQAEKDDKPRLGASASTLGIRFADPANPGKVHDIKIDEKGYVHPDTGGLSVTPDDPKQMYFRHRPVTLGGRSVHPLFVIETARLAPDLKYRPDPERPDGHGFVEPDSSMKAGEYADAITALRNFWRLVP